jgi:hypothetical protein
MGKRRKLRDHERALSRQRHPSAGWSMDEEQGASARVSVPSWWGERKGTGTELCVAVGCDGSCDLWHVL